MCMGFVTICVLFGLQYHLRWRLLALIKLQPHELAKALHRAVMMKSCSSSPLVCMQALASNWLQKASALLAIRVRHPLLLRREMLDLKRHS